MAGVVSGVVMDKSGNTPLGQCSVRILQARDSAFVNGSASADDGKFSVKGLKSGKYIAQFTYLGYNPVTVNFSITDNKPNIDLGTTYMSENSILLKETVVLGARTEITVKEDTVEYNAEAYRTQPNAVVEDLLKRLPGVEVDSDGKITANGKEVSKILIDGKEFFADDPKVASKNLPVDIIDRLQVVDRKSDLARMTGVDDGEEETVINLTVKKGMNNGWFGNFTAGYGTDRRYGFSGIANRFWNGNQLTFLANANNTNNLGFTDGNSGRFRRFGGMNGINTSQSFGVNFNVGKGETFRVGGNILYSHSDNNVLEKTAREYLLADSLSYYNSNSSNRNRGHNVRADFRVKWDIDSFNSLEFRPRFSYNYNKSDVADAYTTTGGATLLSLDSINNSFSTSRDHGKSFEYGFDFIFNHNVKSHPGRSFSVMANFNGSNVREDETAYTHNFFYIDDQEEITDQIINNHTWSNALRTRLTWTEPIGDVTKGNFFEVAYHFNYRWNNADKKVYELPASPDIPTTELAPNLSGLINRELFTEAIANDFARIWGPAFAADPILTRQIVEEELLARGYNLNDELSNSFRNTFFDQRIQVGYKKASKNYNLNAGITLSPTMSRSINLTNPDKTIPSRWVWNVAPYARFRYKFSKSRSLMAFYHARSSQPSMSQLQPVVDNSNPMRVVIGNPSLKPTFNNNIHIRFQDFNQESQRSIMAMINASFATNSIINKTTYDPSTGRQTTTYENVNGVWNIMGMNMINMPFRNKHWQFSNHIFLRANATKGYINSNFNTSTTFSFNESPGITYRNDWLEIQARPNYSLQTTHNTVQGSNNSTVHSYGGMLNATYTTPFGLSLSSDINYSARSGYSQGYNTNAWLWNASLSYQFLRGKAATVALNAYDILQQRLNIRRSVTANYIQDTEYNNLTRYFTISFSYKFNTFGNGKQPDTGFPGGGPGGGRPMGPPPGGRRPF